MLFTEIHIAASVIVVAGHLLLSLCLLSNHVTAEGGYSNSDGSDYEAHSPFMDIEHGDPDLGYAVFREPGSHHDLPVIVWWTEQLWPHYTGKTNKIVTQCGDVSCYSTTSKKNRKKPETRVFVFYGTDINPENLPLPRHPHHEWALFHEESPLNNFILNHKPFIELFNHTATFRNESDFPLTTQNIYRKSYLTERQAVPLEVKNKLRKSKKLAPVLYVQTHCDVPSDRDRYVRELMKHIDVDSYGECLHNRDLPKHLTDPAENYEKGEFLDFISQYKFHLAFENAICEDYMTEKLMRPLFVGSVPIYRGSPNAEDWMPNNHSVIMVDNFSSPSELAGFIKKLDSDNAAYEKYLEFKKSGITNDFLQNHLDNRPWNVNVETDLDYFLGFECHICRKVHERISVEKAHEKDPSVPLLPPKMANNFHLGCPQPYPSIGYPEDIPKKDMWRTTDWVGQYWGDYDRARAVKSMLLAGEKKSKKFISYYSKVVQDDQT